VVIGHRARNKQEVRELIGGHPIDRLRWDRCRDGSYLRRCRGADR